MTKEISQPEYERQERWLRGLSDRPELKISGMGWLCLWRSGRWLPVFKLTEEQLAEWRATC